jgi:hypothetical protein
MKQILTICVLILLSGCVAYPQVIHQNSYKQCDLITKRYRLKAIALRQTCGTLDCLVGGAIFGAGTVVVSGSFMVIGNFVFWIEKQGKCEDSEFNQQIESIRASWLNEPTLIEADLESDIDVNMGNDA